MIQKEKIIAVIRKDATGLGMFKNKYDDYCVIGGLLHEVGEEPKRYQCAPTLVQYEVLFAHYGLQPIDVDELMGCNDNYYEVENRRAALIELVERFE